MTRYHDDSSILKCNYTEKKWKCVYVGDECSICLDSILNKNVCLTECNHSFHSDCLFDFLSSVPSKNRLCPMCRYPLTIEIQAKFCEDDDDNFHLLGTYPKECYKCHCWAYHMDENSEFSLYSSDIGNMTLLPSHDPAADSFTNIMTLALFYFTVLHPLQS